MNRHITVPLVSLGVLLVLASCSGVQQSEKASQESAEPTEISTVITPVDGPGVMKLIRGADAKAVLVNVWATWCSPCVEKFPHVIYLREKYRERGLEVLFVSADFDDQLASVSDFLRERKVEFENYIKTGPDMEFIEAFQAEWSGALPVMFLYDSNGTLIAEWGESMSFESVEETIESVLNQN